MDTFILSNLRVATDPADLAAPILDDHAIAIQGDCIVAIGPSAEILAQHPATYECGASWIHNCWC